MNALQQYRQFTDIGLSLPGLFQSLTRARRENMGDGALILRVINRKRGLYECGFVPIGQIKAEHESLRALIERECKIKPPNPVMFTVMVESEMGWSGYVLSAMVARAEFSSGFCVLAEAHVAYMSPDIEPRKGTGRQPKAEDVFDKL